MALDYLYHADSYRFDISPPTWWHSTTTPPPAPPLDGDARCDVAIVGAGFTGLSAAYHLARDHGANVIALDAAAIGWGASGRNGGFNLPGATKFAVPAMIAKVGRAETGRFWEAQAEGQRLVLAIADQEGFDIDRQADHAIAVAHSRRAYDALCAEGELMAAISTVRMDPLSPAGFRDRVYAADHQHGGIVLTPGCGVNPLKLTAGLATAAIRHGARLCGRSPVQAVRPEAGGHAVVTPHGTVRADQLIIATNGYTPDGLLAPLSRRVLPVISNIMVTRPLSDDELARHGWVTEAPIFTVKNLLYYYRKLPDNRILFGARGDRSGSEAAATVMRSALERKFRRWFPGWADIPTDRFWRGLVAVSRGPAPSIGRLDPPGGGPCWYGLVCFGNGVNNHTWMGRQLAGLAAGDQTLDALPRVMVGLPPRLPRVPALRRLGLGAAFVAYKIRDRFS